MSLMGLAAALMVLMLSVVVVRKLQVRCMLEACQMSGQPGCEYTVNRSHVSHGFAGLWFKAGG